MPTFDDLVFKPSHLNGVQAKHQFPNGYGVSVIRNQYSYGGGEGLFELAITHPDVGLVYDTPITDNVIGHLTPNDVSGFMAQVAALPEKVFQ